MIDFRMFNKMTKTQRLNKVEEILEEYINAYSVACAQSGMFPNIPTKGQVKNELRARKNLITAIDTLMRAQG